MATEHVDPSDVDPSDVDPSDLHFERHLPSSLTDGSPLLVLLHGRGSNEKDLLSLAQHMPEETVVVTPRAPYPAAPWGYGPGWAWYRYVADDRVVDETLDESLKALDRFMERITSELPVKVGHRILGGFSQGGTTSLAWALTRPGQVTGVANFSGFLVDSPLVPMGPNSSQSLDVFWGHGERDPAIPFALAARGRRKLSESGVTLETADHPGGHTITAEEIQGFRQWMERLTGQGQTGQG